MHLPSFQGPRIASLIEIDSLRVARTGFDEQADFPKAGRLAHNFFHKLAGRPNPR